MLDGSVFGADPKATVAAPPPAAGSASLNQTVRLLRDAKIPVSLFRFAGDAVDPLILEYGLERALGRAGLVEPLGDGAVLAILPRFAEDPGGVRRRLLSALVAALFDEDLGGPFEIDMSELHCRADMVADCTDLVLQLLAAPRRSLVLAPTAVSEGPA